MMIQLLNRQPLILSIVAGLLISGLSVYLDPVINNDGILYVHMASLIQQGQFTEAFAAHRMVLLPALMATISMATGGNFELAAHILDAGFYAGTVYLFLLLVRELKGGQTVLAWAFFVVLLFPGLLKYRSMVIRDHGYWFFYLLTLFGLLRYQAQPLAKWLLLALAGGVLAALFRFEGAVLLLLVPLLAIYLQGLRSTHGRLMLAMLALAVMMLFYTLLAWYGAFTTTEYLSGASMGERLGQSLDYRINLIASAIDSIRQHALSPYSKDYAALVWVVSLLAILIAESLGRITLLHLLLAAYALRIKAVLTEKKVFVLWASFVVANIVILTAALFQNQFLQGRFVIPLALTVLLLAPFALQRIRELARAKTKWAGPVFFLCLVIIVGMGVPKLTRATDKTYLRKAGLWIQERVHANQLVSSNNATVLHYAGRTHHARENSDMLDESLAFMKRDINAGQHADFVAVAVDRKDTQLLEQLSALKGYEILREFRSRKGDLLVILGQE